MKFIYKSKYKIIVLLMFLGIISCADLTETNENPNGAEPSAIAAEFVMTSILKKSIMTYPGYGYRERGAAVHQHLQRDFIGADEANQFGWDNRSFNNVTSVLADVSYLIGRSIEEPDGDFLAGTSLVMKSFWNIFASSAWGDIPFSEAAGAGDGLVNPVYDAQKDVFKGILADLEQANTILTGASVKNETATADVLFGGDPMAWRKFANSLQLKILMRLSEKTADAGFDVQGMFSAIASNSGTYPLMLTSDDNAAANYPGTSKGDSFQGGPLAWPNRNEFYRRKPSQTIVNYLRDNADPRLTVWINEVDAQIVEDAGAAGGDEIRVDTDGVVKRFISDATGLDTEKYVGLGIALPNADAWNKNEVALWGTINSAREANGDAPMYGGEGANPHTSYLGDIYQMNNHPLVKAVFMTSADVHFILAEAADRGWIGTDALEHYKDGIMASLDEFDIVDGTSSVYDLGTQEHIPFNLATFMAAKENEFTTATDKKEVILTDRWAANFLNIDAWFVWRRLGIPNLGANLVAGPFGEKMPVRFGYDNNAKILNTENVDAAISKLTPAVDDHWSKMWLIQGTGFPW